jgi:hypothetical protein
MVRDGTLLTPWVSIEMQMKCTLRALAYKSVGTWPAGSPKGCASHRGEVLRYYSSINSLLFSFFVTKIAVASGGSAC